MNLSSAHELKHKIRLTYGPSERGETGIAVGVAPTLKHHEYRVAVRVRADNDLPLKIKEAIKAISAGEVDFRVTGAIKAWPADKPMARARLAIGCSVGHYLTTAGTLGFFAQRTEDGAVGIVSNNHVLALEDEGQEGDDVLCPGPADQGEPPIDVVAHLAGGYPRLRERGQTADCAFARLVEGASYDPLALESREGRERLKPIPATVDGPLDVEKIGRTTGWTHGRVTAFDLDDIDVDYSFGSARFNGAIEVESSKDEPFARGGDSGSLVFNADRQPVGLVYACSVMGGAFDKGRTYLNPIDSVLHALRVTFLA